jgi:predicted small metal-binding protein
MKALTCRELGGACDQKLSAESWEEIVKKITRHVMDEHPKVAKRMEEMHRQDPRQWAREVKPKWEAAAET